MISHDELLRILHYDPTTGSLTWRVNRPPRGKADAVAGWVSKALGYRYINISGKEYLAHVLIWFYMTGGVASP